MTESGKFLPLWLKYKTVVVSLMKQSAGGKKEYQFFKHEFDAAGDRKSLSYKFSFDIDNGVPTKKISAIVVARDLMEVLKSSNAAKDMMRGNYFKIELDKDLKLSIDMVSAPAIEEVAPESAEEVTPEATTHSSTNAELAEEKEEEVETEA